MSKPRILIVEDNGIVAMDIESRLHRFGYDVCGKASYAEKAIEKAKALVPDLILMDIALKGEMDGIEAARIIQSETNISIIFLSAHADEERFDRAKMTNPFGYILKPFRDRELKITIEMALYKACMDAKRIQAEEELKKSEEKYRQAQKMESVGRLAGGVAHDYNNALSVIMGYTELAMKKIDPAESAYTDLEEVLKAADRAADITRQLLAFARKQTISPKVIDLNHTVEGMVKMLRRLIGEDIDFAWVPGENVWHVKMDSIQIDQILANLCINARDAISGVGKVTVETANMKFGQDYCSSHPGFVPGEFVLLAISDDGCGMNKEIQDNIFEPFFTTKDAEKGTGLGMATVYGIVKQNNGFINVYSEPDKGTTIKIYLPRHSGRLMNEKKESMAEIPRGQGEVVLLVEDEPAMLQLAKKILKELGYTVLAAATPGQAMDLAREYTGIIHLLITDVIMPQMNGQKLARHLQLSYPDLKCMFMSGYTANVIVHHGVLNKGVRFIQKPFSKTDLAGMVRKTLDEEKKQ